LLDRGDFREKAMSTNVEQKTLVRQRFRQSADLIIGFENDGPVTTECELIRRRQSRWSSSDDHRLRTQALQSSASSTYHAQAPHSAIASSNKPQVSDFSKRALDKPARVSADARLATSQHEVVELQQGRLTFRLTGACTNGNVVKKTVD
jgi:hypothetical protein